MDIQHASSEPAPNADQLHLWIATALTAAGNDGDTEISLRLVDCEEMTELNRNYRGKDGPTNVLSFPADLPPQLQLPLLGDIVICAPVVAREAAEQGKSPDAHWAHMAVHGTLHLLGYDHLEDIEAQAMETLESTILSRLDFPCPYQQQPPKEHHPK